MCRGWGREDFKPQSANTDCPRKQKKSVRAGGLH